MNSYGCGRKGRVRVHESEVRVRYQETDNMGVVYYANYLVWFEVARTEYFRSLGLVYRELEEKGIYLMVASAACLYKLPAKYDDIVKIRAWVPELKNSSLKFAYKLFVGEKLIATGESLHVFTNVSGKPTRMPDEVKNLFHS
ncbi:MAG: thioesterase family protein [Candidatus Omnitrophota bacterium]|nr:thioesterase family protein [Candidatus Omnitrophota bacterium]